ncbi:PREDICTED: uncharacterized protein Duxb [Chinchilla lanigera]|uniref:uncharacterized protein Duxb n=1 Tax=Chinchilla lanigera TaxID=34839 RepID=UPI000696F5E5|nr:PREDICTED: uncharacterized protein Duxb [Chinchilla lanigera]
MPTSTERHGIIEEFQLGCYRRGKRVLVAWTGGDAPAGRQGSRGVGGAAAQDAGPGREEAREAGRSNRESSRAGSRRASVRSLFCRDLSVRKEARPRGAVPPGSAPDLPTPGSSLSRCGCRAPPGGRCVSAGPGAAAWAGVGFALLDPVGFQGWEREAGATPLGGLWGLCCSEQSSAAAQIIGGGGGGRGRRWVGRQRPSCLSDLRRIQPARGQDPWMAGQLRVPLGSHGPPMYTKITTVSSSAFFEVSALRAQEPAWPSVTAPVQVLPSGSHLPSEVQIFLPAMPSVVHPCVGDTDRSYNGDHSHSVGKLRCDEHNWTLECQEQLEALNHRRQGLLERKSRRQRMILNENKKDILNEWFETNPYPGIDTRDFLAKVISISEFQILRRRRRQREYECNFGKYQTQAWNKLQFSHEGNEARHIWTNFTRPQIETLIQASDQNHLPRIAVREELAKQTGIPEKKIMKPASSTLLGVEERDLSFSGDLTQSEDERADSRSSIFSDKTWFLNQKALHQHPENRGVPADSVAEGPCQTSHARNQLPPKDHSTDPRSSRYLPLPNAVTSKRSLVPGMTPGVKISLCPTNQGQCHGPKEHTTTEILLSEDSAQPLFGNQQWLGVDQVDSYLFLQHWDELLQSIIAEWDPYERTSVSRKN